MQKYIFSKYNVFKTFNDTVVGINLFRKMIFAIDIEKYSKICRYSNKLDRLEKDDPVLFSLMHKLGVIQTSVFDTSIYRSLLLNNRIENFNSSEYRLTINPTLNCNFSCWYCYESHPKRRMSKETVTAILKFIDNLTSEKNLSKFYLDWFGGEPLLCYNTVMKQLATGAKKICTEKDILFESGMTTNGYLIKEDMIPFFEEINMQSFQITLDGAKNIHNTIRYTKANRGDSYDRIVRSIILLAEKMHPQNLALRINFTRESFSSVKDIIASFPTEVRKKITILLQQVWQDKDNGKVSIQEIEGLRLDFAEAGFLIDKEILNTKGYSCYADKYNQAVINYDGRIFKCTAKNFEKEREDGTLTKGGEIVWSEILLPLKLSKATFENKKCMNCKYLPVCFGPCSQKVSTVKEPGDFDKFCFEGGIEETLSYIMTEFEKTGKGLAPLLNYR